MAVNHILDAVHPKILQDHFKMEFLLSHNHLIKDLTGFLQHSVAALEYFAILETVPTKRKSKNNENKIYSSRNQKKKYSRGSVNKNASKEKSKGGSVLPNVFHTFRILLESRKVPMFHLWLH